MRHKKDDTKLIASIVQELIESKLWVSSVELEHVHELFGAQAYVVGNSVFYELQWRNVSKNLQYHTQVHARIRLVGKAIQVMPIVHEHFDTAAASSLEKAANKLLNDRVLDAIVGEVFV